MSEIYELGAWVATALHTDIQVLWLVLSTNLGEIMTVATMAVAMALPSAWWGGGGS